MQERPVHWVFRRRGIRVKADHLHRKWIAGAGTAHISL